MGDLGKEINSKFPNEKVKAMLNIKFTAGWLDQIGNRLLKPHNISEQQIAILSLIHHGQYPEV